MPTLAQLQAQVRSPSSFGSLVVDGADPGGSGVVSWPQLTPEAFTASLRTVMAKRGVKIQARYVIDDNEISLYDLYQTVLVVGGGVEQVRPVPSSASPPRHFESADFRSIKPGRL